ncbi:MAG: PEGA domain-containing protein [Acidobacteriaceae bacterium]
MTLRSRFALVIAGIVIFLILGPGLIIFSLGYKLDLEDWKLVKTGSLMVKTEPKGAVIFIDGKKSKYDTPATVRFLIPGDYTFTIKKDKYQDWTKRLSIQSQLVTWVNLNRDFITLFFQQPESLGQTSLETEVLSPDMRSLVFVENGRVKRIDANNGKTDDLGENNFWNLIKTGNLQVSPNNLYYLLLYNRNLGFPTDQIAQISKIETNDNYSVWSDGKITHAANSAGQEISNFSGVSDFLLEGQNLWLVQNGQFLEFNLNGKTLQTISTSVPTGANTKIIRGNGQTFLVVDQTLYSLNAQAQRIYSPVTSAHFDPNGKQLLFANGHEVFILDPLSLQSALILRSTTAIQNPVINDETGYLFYSNEAKIKAIELDDRDHRNVYNLTDAKEVFLPSDNGKNLFVSGSSLLQNFQIR